MKIERGRASSDPRLRYRVDVIAPNVLNAVESVGGWLFDRAMGGWDVNVMVYDHDDSRPLKILGARSLGLRHALISRAERPPAQTMAISSDLFCRDTRVRQTVSQALQRPFSEVALWGAAPLELGPSIVEMRHELSSAARVFKSHALAAACRRETASVGGTETFRCRTIARPSRLRPLFLHGLRA
jgi:hypothetical protein